jgi:hypothetical protein
VDGPEYRIPDEVRFKLVKYLVEFIASLTERYPLPSAKPLASFAPYNLPQQRCANRQFLFYTTFFNLNTGVI